MIEELAFVRKPDADDHDQNIMSPIQSAVENPRIEFREGQFVFRMVNEAGGVIERFISAAQVRQAFTGVPIESGWLPPGIVRWGNGTIGEWAVGFIPPQVHRLELTREIAAAPPQEEGAPPAAPAMTTDVDRIHVSLPGLVWFGIGVQYHIWAVKTRTLEPYQEIFRAPLPNIYANGSICWGVVKPERMTAATFFKAYDLLMGATFTNHLASAKSKLHHEDVRETLRRLAAPEWTGTGVRCECGDAKSEHQFYDDHDECHGPNCRDKAAPCCNFEAAAISPPPDYPVDDLMRQVPNVGVSLDTAIRSYFETGAFPS